MKSFIYLVNCSSTAVNLLTDYLKFKGSMQLLLVQGEGKITGRYTIIKLYIIERGSSTMVKQFIDYLKFMGSKPATTGAGREKNSGKMWNKKFHIIDQL